MQEKKAPVFIVATANDVSQLGALVSKDFRSGANSSIGYGLPAP